MGKINVIAKWELDKNKWDYNSSAKEYGRSFAFANYNKIINNEEEKVDYIIIAQGSRVEDHSKNFIDIKERKVRIDNVISHYEKCNGNYEIKLFLIDADAPIVQDAMLFASYIDSLSVLKSTNTINVIGLSKCGAMSYTKIF